MSEVYLRDPDLTLWHGDVLETLSRLEDASIDCCITSPPYFGLRDYGTGEWEGGEKECDHTMSVSHKKSTLGASTGGRSEETHARSIGAQATPYANVCGKCGARRIDQQIGLEDTPEQYVERMVEVFREVRRVLAAHGTVWLNLGDSYASQGGPQVEQTKQHIGSGYHGANRNLPGLKPKDLVGIPWRVAFALQADGWYLRSDIIWAKDNPMPESISDRPTKSHEYVFLMSKRASYYFDQESVREPFSGQWKKSWEKHPKNPLQANPNSPYREQGYMRGGGVGYPDAEGRNIRTVWNLPSQPFSGAHFAVFPEELVRRALLAGCPEKVCQECGKPSERIVEKEKSFESGSGQAGNVPTGKQDLSQTETNSTPDIRMGPTVRTRTVGWTDCGHNVYRAGVVLDPFGGSGTTAFVARKHARHSVLIELNESYCEIISKRLAQQSLLT